MPGQSRSILYLVDGHSYIFRAFHAIRHLSTQSGTLTNAVYGVTKMLLKLLDDKDPSHVAVVLDAGGKNFRHEMYPEYKANRPPAPEELKIQIPLVKEIIQALNLALLQEPGCEADDVIATVCKQAVAEGFEVVIVSGDKDLMQLVGERVVMYDTMKQVVYDSEGVEKKMGVPPGQVLDLLALMGDTSDNIPGVYGVGQKTASKLLQEHGDLEAVLSAAPSMKKSKLKERLINQADNARLSKKLASLAMDVYTGHEPEEFARKDYDRQALDELLQRLEFPGLRRQLVGRRTIDTGKYKTIFEKKALGQVIARIKQAGKCSVDLETTSLDPARAHIVGISLAPAAGDAVYIPVAHEGEDSPVQLSVGEVLDALGPVLADPTVRIYGQNIKYDMVVLLNRQGLKLGNVACDAMLASYVLDPGRAGHGMDSLSREFLGHETITYSDVVGKGKNEIPFARVPIDRASAYSGEDADVTFRLCELLLPKVKQEEDLWELFAEIELPLIHVLADMELWGIEVDGERLEAMSGELQREIEKLEERIHLLAGREFNINSPAQLRVVLFDELGFEVKKKTKSGASTDSTVLEELALEHELPTEILNYRSLAKLKSTYVDVLPEMVNPETGRIHTSYNQAVTATGRLSSSHPNLQNIPVRTETGRRIREAFVASEGCVLLSADYSQVELRILAHLSEDEALLEAFSQGEDVHARTAALIFGVPVERVDSAMRRKAKAVNFGIVYGQGPYNLARQLRISRPEAKEIIEGYLDRHRRVRDWVDATHQKVRETMMVKTMFGRRRYLPDINSTNHNVRSNAERMAQNTPIQGTAADIIKRAMIQIHAALKKKKMKTRMVLQVHDELVFDVPDAEIGSIESLVREKMEGAARLAVPLTVDISTAGNWAEAH
jgi:DNA polymerase-1